MIADRPEGGTAQAASATKKVFVKTYGCQMNVYDSQRMSDALAADGYAGTDRIEDADLVLLNTCHIREKAAEKVYSELGRIRDLKAERASRGLETVVGVAGCVAQAEGAEIIRSPERCRPGDRSADLSPPARGAEESAKRREGRRDRLRHRGQVRTSAEAAQSGDHRPRRDGLPDRTGRLRQVLHLLRRALYARLGSVAAGVADRRRGRKARRGRRARGDTARPERQRLARRRARMAGNGGSAGCCPGWRKSPASPGCATRPAIRATWTTN